MIYRCNGATAVSGSVILINTHILMLSLLHLTPVLSHHCILHQSLITSTLTHTILCECSYIPEKVHISGMELRDNINSITLQDGPNLSYSGFISYLHEASNDQLNRYNQSCGRSGHSRTGACAAMLMAN